jgi:hypothetical protein
MILVENRQIIEPHEFKLEVLGRELDKRFGELAIDGIVSSASDDDCDMVGHRTLLCWLAS